MANNTMNFPVDYHQIGSSEDVDDWAYTAVVKNIIDADLVTIKCNGSSSPKKEMQEIVKDFIAMVPNGKLLTVSKATYRSKVYYLFVDGKDYLTYLSFSYSKKEKVIESDFSLATGSPDVAIAFEAYIKENFTNEKKNSVYVISQGSSGLTLQNMGPLESVLERDNYSQDVVESYDYIVGELNKAEPNGRLTIFNGPPGSGKTRMIRALVSQVENCLIVLLPSKLVSEIDSPALITLIADEKSEYGTMDRDGDGKQTFPILFIVEDADHALVPRENDNILTISSLLNLTDGILGSMLDLRVIATTNQEHINFDEALMRPGRLCKHVYVGQLDPARASQIYKRLSGKEKEYKKSVTLATVYADSKGSVEKPIKTPKNTVGFV